MRSLQVSVGDIIEISVKKKSTARTKESYTIPDTTSLICTFGSTSFTVRPAEELVSSIPIVLYRHVLEFIVSC
jgi:hypothetical protein